MRVCVCVSWVERVVATRTSNTSCCVYVCVCVWICVLVCVPVCMCVCVSRKETGFLFRLLSSFRPSAALALSPSSSSFPT